MAVVHTKLNNRGWSSSPTPSTASPSGLIKVDSIEAVTGEDKAANIGESAAGTKRWGDISTPKLPAKKLVLRKFTEAELAARAKKAEEDAGEDEVMLPGQTDALMVEQQAAECDATAADDGAAASGDSTEELLESAAAKSANEEGDDHDDPPQSYDYSEKEQDSNIGVEESGDLDDEPLGVEPFAGTREDQTLAYYEAVSNPGEVREVRMLNGTSHGRPIATASAYVNNGADFVRIVREMDEFGGNTYFLLNPAVASLIARAPHDIITNMRPSTSDGEIEWRRNMVIDIDPDRPAGIPANAKERKAARKAARWVIRKLRTLGIPDPIVIDSGNGFQLIVRVDLPNDPESRDAVKKALEGLAHLMDVELRTDSPVHVDTGMFNASRIVRVPTTMNRKGQGSPDRPHRSARIVHIPTQIGTAARWQLEALGLFAPSVPVDERGNPARGAGKIDLRVYFGENGPGKDVPVSHWKEKGDGTLIAVLGKCVWDESHDDGAAFVMQLPNGAIAAGCLHNSCSGKGWHDLRDAVEQGWRESQAPKGRAFGNQRATGPEYDDPALEWTLPENDEDAHSTMLFPVDSLPEPFRSFILSSAESLQVSTAAVGPLVLAVIAICLQRRVEVMVNSEHQETLSIFVIVGMPSGSRKSALIAMVSGPIRAYELETNMAVLKRQAESQRQLPLLTKRLSHLEKKAAMEDDQNARAEVLVEIKSLQEEIEKLEEGAGRVRRFMVDEATPEKCAMVMCENDERIGMLSAESDGIEFISGAKYGKGPSLGLILKAHDGDPHTPDRIGSGTTVLARPALTIGSTAQPTHIRSFEALFGSEGRGLLPRFLFSIPPNNIGYRKIETEPIPPAVKAAYNAVVRAMISEPVPETPKELTLSPGAARVKREYHSEVERESQPGGRLGGMPAWASKLVGNTIRVAALLHEAAIAAGKTEDSNVISAETMSAAVEIGRFFEEHTIAAFAVLGADKTADDGHFLLAALKRFGVGELPKRDLWHATKGRFASRVTYFNAAVDRLRSQGYIRKYPGKKPDGAAPQGRKPGYTIAVNPLVIETWDEGKR